MGQGGAGMAGDGEIRITQRKPEIRTTRLPDEPTQQRTYVRPKPQDPRPPAPIPSPQPPAPAEQDR